MLNKLRKATAKTARQGKYALPTIQIVRINLNKSGSRPRSKKAGSRVLIDITVLVLIVFILSGIAMFLFFRKSQSRLVEKSKEKLVEYTVDQIWSTNGYFTNLITRITMLSIPGSTPQSIENEIFNGIKQQTVTQPQRIINDMLGLLVENGLFGSKMVFYSIPSQPDVEDKPIIIMSSDADSIYNHVPSELVSLATMSKNDNTEYRKRIDSQNSSMLTRRGIPELGLKGEYLATAYKFTPEGQSMEIWYFDLIPMHEQLAAINSFYDTARRNIDLTLILIMISSIIALVLITYFILSYLIRSRITMPMGELSNTAEKVMEGDIDVVVPVKKGEEFYMLKTTFNDMLSSLRKIILRTSEDRLYSDDTAEAETPTEKHFLKWLRGKTWNRSSILFQISIILITVFVVSGILSLILFQQSEAKLIEKSKEKIVQSIGETICSGHYYLSSLIAHYFTLKTADSLNPDAIRNLFSAIANKQISPLQKIMNDGLKELVDKRFQGLVLAFEALDPIPGILDKTTIVISSDDKYMYTEPPKELEDLFEMPSGENTAYRMRVDENDSFMLVDGIPSMGLSGKYLVMAYKHEPDPSTPEFFKFYNFKPMARQLVAIDDFYDTESNNALLFISVMILIDIGAVLVITLIILKILIRQRITRPVDELSRIAEEVADGNLDIEVPIQKGEEFESLKTAFNEMLTSLRKLISKIGND